MSALLGGILVVTGPTVILPLLRQARLKARPASILKWEAIVNDPLGALFAVIVFELIRITQSGGGYFQLITGILIAACIGGVLGWGAGFGLARFFRAGIIPEYLKAPIVLATVLAVYVISEFIAHETGLIAATAMGMSLANSRIASIVEMRRFKESIAVLLVSGIFVALTANINPDVFVSFNIRSIAFVLVMLFCVRPLTIWISMLGSGLSFREKLLIGWIAPRGVVAVAVSGYFAGKLVLLGYPEGEALLPLTFAIVFSTVVLHGFSIRPLSRILGLAIKDSQGVLIVGANAWSLGLATALKKMDIPVLIADSNWRRLKAIRLQDHDVFYGEVLSEAADYRLDHNHFSSLIALTSNDAYNALVCMEFGPELGRHRVFQFSSYTRSILESKKEKSDSKLDQETQKASFWKSLFFRKKDHSKENSYEIAYTARGRVFGTRGRSYDSLMRDWWNGWKFTITLLSETYTLEDYLKERENEPIDFFAEKLANGTLNLLQQNSKLKGEPGSQILAFMPVRHKAKDQT